MRLEWWEKKSTRNIKEGLKFLRVYYDMDVKNVLQHQNIFYIYI